MQTDIDHAYDFCKEVAIKHYENFPVGSLLIPSDKRKYIYSIYAFARHADDIADSDKLTETQKLSMLSEFEADLNKAENKDFAGLNSDTSNIFIALSNTIDELKIPAEEFRNLLIAFKQDSVKQRYFDFEELISYSKYSANPIGHLVLYVFGYNPEKDKKCFGYSDKICTALQLTNFWQDVSVDLEIDRIYIPEKLMNEFNYDENMLFEKNENDDFRKLIKALIDKTKLLFDEGRQITNYVKGRLRLELKATIEGGEMILNKIEKINFNVLSTRVALNKFDKIKLAGKLI